jgi:serine/threonine protein phosphatase 1
MLEARRNRQARARWEETGGLETLMSYGTESIIRDEPELHWDILESFVPFLETEKFIFVHAIYSWYTPMNEQPASLLRWKGIDVTPPMPHPSGKTAVCGHTPGPIMVLGFCLCIDT